MHRIAHIASGGILRRVLSVIFIPGRAGCDVRRAREMMPCEADGRATRYATITTLISHFRVNSKLIWVEVGSLQRQRDGTSSISLPGEVFTQLDTVATYRVF